MTCRDKHNFWIAWRRRCSDAGRWVPCQDYFVQAIHNAGLFEEGTTANQAMFFGRLPGWAEELAKLVPTQLLPPEVACRAPLFNQATCNVYTPGQGIIPHIDLLRFEDGIAIWSFEGKAIMHLYCGDRDHHKVLLEPGDLLLLTQAARYEWLHGIEAVAHEELRPGVSIDRAPRRVSVTLRRLAGTVIQLADPAR